MTVPITNVGLSAIQTNFGGANPIALSEYYRGGANVPASQGNGGYGVVAASGPLSVGTFRNQEKVFTTAYTISVDTTNLNLITLLTSLGWDGIVPVRMDVTINSGIVVSSNNTAIPALAIGSALPSGSIVRIYNYGYIIGMGGQGGHGSIGTLNTTKGLPFYQMSVGPTSGLPGGPALAYTGTLPTSAPIQLFNYGTIGGGGGGGGGAASLAQAYGPDGGGGRSGRTNTVVPGVWGYPGTFAGAGPGLVPTGHGNSGPGGGWGGYGGVGSAWPGDWTASYGGGGGAAIVGVAGFTVSVVGTRYGSVS